MKGRVKLGLDAEVLRRQLEPKAGEPFDAERSATLDRVVGIVDEVDALRVVVERVRAAKGSA